MTNHFLPGDILECNTSSSLHILSLLKENKDSVIYAVEQDKQKKILKWYSEPDQNTGHLQLCERIQEVYLNGAIDRAFFLLPENVIRKNDGAFGFTIPFVPDKYRTLHKCLKFQREIAPIDILVSASLNIIRAFINLHASGYCLKNLDTNCIYIDLENGNILIDCVDRITFEDNDIAYNGDPEFLPPELIKIADFSDSVIARKIDRNIDRFSMAVIIFMLLFKTGPFTGKRASVLPYETASNAEQLLLHDPHFIMEDINSPEYRPDPDRQKYAVHMWEIIPEYIKTLFLKAFVPGKNPDPASRPGEKVWTDAFMHFANNIIRCHCGMRYIYRSGKQFTCDCCGSALRIPYKLYVQEDNYCIPCIPGNRIYLVPNIHSMIEDYFRPIGAVVSKRKEPEKLGIRNHTEVSWKALANNGSFKEVSPDSVVPLYLAKQINIGSKVLKIENNTDTDISVSKATVNISVPFIFMLDASAGMSGKKIQAVNQAIEKTIDALQNLNQAYSHMTFKTCIMQIRNEAQWSAFGLENVSENAFEPLDAYGMTNIGAALKELHRILSIEKITGSETEECTPVILFMPDGCSQDSWQEPLNELKAKNQLFSQSVRIGIVLGDDADENMLSEIAGSDEQILRVTDIDSLETVLPEVIRHCIQQISANSVSGENMNTDEITLAILKKIRTENEL